MNGRRGDFGEGMGAIFRGVGNPKLKCTQLFSPLAQTIGVVWVTTEISVSI
jgi:hypothetical protein